MRLRIVGTVAAASRHGADQRAGAAAVRARHRRPGPARRAAGGTGGPRARLCGGAVAVQGAERAALGALRADRAAHPPPARAPALEHLHALSLSFHLARRTGQISRILDQGLNGARELLFDGVFLILPLAAEMLFVPSIMLARLDGVFAAILLATVALYGVRAGRRARSGCGRTSARPWPRAQSRTARRWTAC